MQLRNVSLDRPGAPFPACAARIAQRLQALPDVPAALDQLTVNEYAPGVGLSSHVDTHSAFTGPLYSSWSAVHPAVQASSPRYYLKGKACMHRQSALVNPG